MDDFLSDPWLTPVRLWNKQRAWVATRFDDVRALLADPRLSALPTRPGFPILSEGRAQIVHQQVDSFIRLDGEEHARIRKMFTAEFTVKRISDLRERTIALTNSLIDRMLAGSKPVDFVKAFSLKLPSNLMGQILGVPEEDEEFFQDCGTRMIDLSLSAAENMEAAEEFRLYICRLVDSKRANPGADDLITRLIRERLDTGELTYDETVATIQLLIIAGHETTAHTLSLSTILLLLDRRNFEAIGQSNDPKFFRNAIEELLRYTSVVQYQTGRLAMEDVEIRGHTIRKGEGVWCFLPAANRDPDRFENPEQLDIFREIKVPHVAFGFGAHQCLGQALARLELQVALELLTRRIPTLRLAGTLDDIEFKGLSLTHGVHNMMVTW